MKFKKKINYKYNLYLEKKDKRQFTVKFKYKVDIER